MCFPVGRGTAMRRWGIVVVTLLGGCVGVDCGPDWRAVGQRDGRMNAGSQVERYAARCGAPVDRATYEQGYGEGFAQRPPPTGI
jgi:hypothetical protein